MKWFIVSEEELERLKGAAFSEAVNQMEGNELTDELEKAKAACRARPVEARPGRAVIGEGLFWEEIK